MICLSVLPHLVSMEKYLEDSVAEAAAPQPTACACSAAAVWMRKQWCRSSTFSLSLITRNIASYTL